MINGNITDVKSMAVCVKEFGRNDVMYIADKGFYSRDNVEMLEKERLQYIVPLRRNNSQIDLSILQQPDFKREIKYFSYPNRIIWYYSYTKEGNQIITFLDEHLRVSKKNDYLNRIKTHPEKYSIDKLLRKVEWIWYALRCV
jgi:transposase